MHANLEGIEVKIQKAADMTHPGLPLKRAAVANGSTGPMSDFGHYVTQPERKGR